MSAHVLQAASKNDLHQTRNVLQAASKNDLHQTRKLYSLVGNWLQTPLSYATLRAIMCIRGSRSSHNHPVYEHNLTFVAVECKILFRTYFLWFVYCLNQNWKQL